MNRRAQYFSEALGDTRWTF